MSINYCSIGTATVDAFCGLTRAKVLARLIHEAGHDVIVPTPTQHGGGATIRPRPQWVNNSPPIQNFEQSRITVSVMAFGVQSDETQEMTSRLDFVTVTGLEINSSTPETVNISKLEI